MPIHIAVYVAGGRSHSWTFPGDETELRAAWTAGRAPVHLCEEWAFDEPAAFDGTVQPIERFPADADRVLQLEPTVRESVLYLGDEALRWVARSVPTRRPS